MNHSDHFSQMLHFEWVCHVSEKLPSGEWAFITGAKIGRPLFSC